MQDKRTKNLSIDQKTKLVNNRFPERLLSRSSVHKIQRKILGFSYKRVSKFRPHIKSKNKHLLSKMVFINRYLEFFSDQNREIIIVDGNFPSSQLLRFLEAGFGTSSFRKYGNPFSLFLLIP